jgi:hypothetical protein
VGASQESIRVCVVVVAIVSMEQVEKKIVKGVKEQQRQTTANKGKQRK